MLFHLVKESKRRATRKKSSIFKVLPIPLFLRLCSGFVARDTSLLSRTQKGVFSLLPLPYPIHFPRISKSSVRGYFRPFYLKYIRQQHARSFFSIGVDPERQEKTPLFSTRPILPFLCLTLPLPPFAPSFHFDFYACYFANLFLGAANQTTVLANIVLLSILSSLPPSSLGSEGKDNNKLNAPRMHFAHEDYAVHIGFLPMRLVHSEGGEAN